MKNNQQRSDYTSLAELYDILGEHLDPEKYAALASRLIKEHGNGTSGIVLDIACGTGSLLVELSKLGYDIIGNDLSVDMLDIAREKCQASGIAPLLLNQNMCELDLYGTVDAVIAATDSLNYITKPKDLERVFALTHNFLEPGGIFLFDINSEFKFESFYGDNTYCFEDDGVFVTWQNEYNRRSKLCRFYLNIFKEEDDGRYIREEELHTERCYPLKSIMKMLSDTHFKIIGTYSDLELSPVTDQSPRIFIAAKAIKN